MLAVIALATLIEDTIEVEVMIAKGTVMLADLLLLFFYLEIFAIVGVYFCSGQLPGGGSAADPLRPRALPLRRTAAKRGRPRAALSSLNAGTVAGAPPR